MKNAKPLRKLNEQFHREICAFVREYQAAAAVQTEFGEPIVGFADAGCAEIQALRSVIGPNHVLPQDVIPDASVIISYYVPFTRALATTNGLADGRPTGTASPEWAAAYEELNALFGRLNAHLIDVISGIGFKGAVPDAASTFDKTALISNWSQRHIAYAAGLGTFGINNMLITRNGCCGRFNSVVTNIDKALLPPDSPMSEGMCLYKRNPGVCGICAKNCPSGALTVAGTDVGYSRRTCYDLCLENAAVYPVENGSYGGEASGSEVCGKCITQSPCAFWKK